MLSKIKTKWLVIISFCIYVISLIPVVYMGFFNYATGDDYYYGAPVKHAIENGDSFLQIIRVAWNDVIREYYGFQGTLATMFVWRFEPSIWGEKAYTITIFISLGILNLGIFYLLHVIIVRLLELDRSTYLVAGSMTMFFVVQYMVYPRSGLYFFPGVIRYSLAFGFVCLAMGLAVMYLKSGGKKRLVGIIFLLTYLGGSGFPSIVMSGLGISFLIICGLLSKEDEKKRRALILIIPAILELIGFTIAATSPGNAVRGGEDFGFSLGRVLQVFYRCFTNGTIGIFKYFTYARPLVLLPIGLFILAYISNTTVKIRVKDIIIVGIIGWFIVCMTRSPEYYAGNTVMGGFSGGVYDSYYYISMIYIVTMSLMLGMLAGTGKKNEAVVRNAIGAFVAFMLLFVDIINKYLLKNMLDYTIYDYIITGQAQDFEEQMQQRLQLLSTDEMDVVVPDINDQQGPFMHMPVTKDAGSYTNAVTADLYNKRTIVAIPRDEWEEKYGQ